MIASGVPPGLGEPVFDRLDADIAHALMGINAVKAVEIGAGVRAAVAQRGSEHRDELTPQGFRSNHAGGMLGGISSGQDIVAHLTLKPTSSIQVPGRTIDTAGKPVEVVTTGRHDPCVGLRATPIAEAMLAIVLHGPLPAPPRAERRCAVSHAGHHRDAADRGGARHIALKLWRRCEAAASQRNATQFMSEIREDLALTEDLTYGSWLPVSHEGSGAAVALAFRP